MKFIDLTGKRFGRFTVIYRTDRKTYGTHYWHCRCDCGKEVDVLGSNLRRGLTTSCGCYFREVLAKIKPIDITGQRFGHLVALYPTEKRAGSFVVWHCKCDCGREKDISISHLRSGNTKSCAMCDYRHETIREKNTVWKTDAERSIISVFHGMKSRCYNPHETRNYPLYGGRGITVCDEWLQNPRAFVDWSLSHGYAPGLSIDRVDSNGPYAPWNCRWATATEQANNTRSNRRFTVNGETMTMAEWAREIGVVYEELQRHANKSDYDAVWFIKCKLAEKMGSDEPL